MKQWLQDIMADFGIEHFQRYYAVYRGTVLSNLDPEKRARIMVSVPQVYGKNKYEYWAEPKGIYAGKGIGSYWLPNEGDAVWVSFENGDSRYPVWEYGWWVSKGDNPEGSDVDVKVLQTTSGHRLVFNDKEKKIQIEDGEGHGLIEINENGISLVTENFISLGTLNESAEPAVLGDTLHDLLKEYTDDLGALMAIVTSNGITDAINTAGNWLPFKNKWEQKWDDYKSAKVSLD